MSIYASSSTVTQQTTPRIVVDPATVQEGWILVWDESEGVFIAQPAATDDSGQLISLRGILSVEEYDSQDHTNPVSENVPLALSVGFDYELHAFAFA